jgi:hypothetical protein
LDNKANTVLSPKDVKGIAGFLFDVPDSDSINLDWDITDHFTESNSFLNDHKVKKPVIITLSGFVGELVFRSPAGVEGAAQEISNRLEAVDAYLGDFTPGAVQEAQRVVQQAQSAISAINQTLDKVQNVIGFFDGEEPEETAQQKAFNQLSALGDEVIVATQTPWGYFDSMSIMALGFTQDGTTKEITDISVTLKEIRVSETKTTDFDKNQFPVREQVQSGPEEDQGNIRAQNENSSLLFKTLGG